MHPFAYEFMVRATTAAVLTGATCGIVGVWVVLLNIPFIGIAMSHAAFAGAVFGILLGVPPVAAATLCCVASALIIGPLADRGRLSANASLSVVFSAVLGLAFLGMGFIRGPRTEALTYLWGNILTVSPLQVRILAVTAAVVMVFLVTFRREIFAVLYDREIAHAVGIDDGLIFYLLLGLSGVVVALSVGTVGGLLIYSLVTTTPLAARQVTRSLGAMYVVSAIFGIVVCLVGLMVSYWLSVPTGASIILASGLLFGVCMFISRSRRNTL